jgi:hypothetical protein
MSIAFSLVEATPYRLRYLATATAEGTGASTTGVITNRGTGSPDLRGDADTFNDGPMHKLVSRDGSTQAKARTLLNGDGLTANTDLVTQRAKLEVIPRNALIDASGVHWAVDAIDGNTGDAGAPPAGSNGFPCVQVTAPNVSGAIAYVDIHFQHSYSR